MAITRYAIENALRDARRRLDDSMRSPGARGTAALAGAVALASVVAGGVWVWQQSQPPALPTSAQEAARVIAAGRLDRLDDDRRDAYMQEARRLLSELPRDEARRLMDESGAAEQLREARMNEFDELARRIARGESIEEVFQAMRERGGFGRPGQRRPEGERGERPGGGERAGRPEGGQSDADRRERFVGRMNEMIGSGDSQRMAIMMEFRRAMREARESGGNNGGRRNGGN